MKNKAILLVEDNPDDVELTRRFLEKNNVVNPVLVAQDGIEAIEMLRHGEPPALVLLDLKLPKMDGLQLLQIIRTEDRLEDLPIVILTVSKEDRDVLQSYAGGANSFIRKPLDFTKFNDAVRQLGLYWLMLNEPPPLSRRFSALDVP